MKRKKKLLRQPVAIVAAAADKGLSPEQVRERTDKGWANGAIASAGKTEWDIVAENLLTFFNLVFAVLAAALWLTGSSVKNTTFLIVVVCNICIGCYQEIRAKRAVDRLTLVAAQKIRVIRSGKTEIVPSEQLVRDDVAEFTAGDQICADGILLEGALQVNEALITGEEEPVAKQSGDSLLSGSFVVAGTGRVRLTEVGADAFASKLALEAKSDPHAAKSEMMRSLEQLIRAVGFALIPVGLALFYQEFYVLDRGLTASAQATVAALVGMIPEGLYLLTSVAMAASSLKLSRDKVLVKDLNCIEALARVDVLCVDKTGTITEPMMEVAQVVALSGATDAEISEILTAFYAGTEPENDTARAMAEHFAGQSSWICTERIPFTSQTKQSRASFEGFGSFVVGAPEFVLGQQYALLQPQAEEFLQTGSRVLLLAREGAGLQPLALIVLRNRIRAAAPETFRYFREQGVAVKVISGDNPLTVSRVALQAGIPGAERYVDAASLHTPEDFARAAEECVVFGRVTPEQKKKLLQAMKAAGHTVAMTGDGVNDVLALKEANCSIAMASGAQAASQVAQLVLLKSDFAAMPAIVGEGRRVINNIQRAASLFLVKNILSMGLALICLISGQSYPFIPFHLTLLSALTIGAPAFFLAMEPNYERVSGSFLKTVLKRALPGGLANLFMVLLAQLVMSAMQIPAAQISTACTGIVAAVGLLVLDRTCRPYDAFRRILWLAMATALVFCFTVLSGFFDLVYGSLESILLTVLLVAAAPAAFYLAEKCLALVHQARKKF